MNLELFAPRRPGILVSNDDLTSFDTSVQLPQVETPDFGRCVCISDLIRMWPPLDSVSVIESSVSVTQYALGVQRYHAV